MIFMACDLPSQNSKYLTQAVNTVAVPPSHSAFVSLPTYLWGTSSPFGFRNVDGLCINEISARLHFPNFLNLISELPCWLICC